MATNNATIAEINEIVAGQTVPRLFEETVLKHGNRVALRAMSSEQPGTWDTYTWVDYAGQVALAAAGLSAFGVVPGQRVMLMMRNRPDFHWLDMAIQCLRATPVSIYNSSSAEELQYLVSHSGAEVAIVEDRGYLDRFLSVRDELPLLQHIFVIDPGDDPLPDGVRSASTLYNQGALNPAPLIAETQPSDVATIIYTSGTTGPPKGVVLTQYNIVYTAQQLIRCMPFTIPELVGARMVSYLPMAHIAERMNSHYASVLYGMEISTCPDPNRIAEYAREVHPEIIFGVPRVWEKVHAGVNGALAGDPERQAKFDEAIAAALPIMEAKRKGTITEEQQGIWDFLDAVAFSTVRQLVGLDAVRSAISGAAPIQREVLEWFNAIGVPLSEIYGMSESSGPMTWDAVDIRPGTVGRALPGSEVRIAEDGEVLFRGGNVFFGYLNAPDKTAETLVDGWLHSGDIGELDEEGYLKIVDRKKELIITSGGKNISPANLEAGLKGLHLIGQACAIGDQRKYVTALLVLDPDVAPQWAKAQGIEVTNLVELAKDPQVLADVAKGVDEVNQQFANVEHIKRFTLLGEEWLPDSDVLTPTSKLKRRGILARYKAEIDAMYD